MPRAVIQFIGKTWTLLGDAHEIETVWVPTVGEMICAEGPPIDPSSRESPFFMVQSVVYKMTNEGFVPHITARQWFKGLREELLRGRGWLPSDGSEVLVHDEDDPALPLTA